jgi:hypothetical protein
MVSKEFKNTNKLLPEFNKFEEIIELDTLKLTNPKLVNQIEASENSKDIFLSQPDEQLKLKINQNFNKKKEFNEAKK